MSHRKDFLLTLVLLVATTIGIYAILYPFSPRSVKADIYTLRYLGDGWENRYQIQGDQMTCEQEHDYPSTICSTTFEGQPLTINVTYTDDTRHLASYCRVVYAEQAINCKPTINYENFAPTLIIEESLGVSTERAQELRAETPWLYLPESQWIAIVQGLAGMIALAIVIWRWWHYPKLSTRPEGTGRRLIYSLLVGLFTWFGLAWGLSFLIGPITTETSESLWAVMPVLGIIGGALAFGAEWKLSGGGKPETAVFRSLYSIGGGFVFFAILNFAFMGALLMLGFVD